MPLVPEVPLEPEVPEVPLVPLVPEVPDDPLDPELPAEPELPNSPANVKLIYTSSLLVKLLPETKLLITIEFQPPAPAACSVTVENSNK